jgi:hypothetical protein
VDAKERIRTARAATPPILERSAKAPEPSVSQEEQRCQEKSASTPLRSETQSPGTAEAPTQPILPARWRALEEQVVHIRVAIERSRREANQNVWIVAIACLLLVLGAILIENRIYPRPSAADQRLQKLGADLSERWQTLSEKERLQIEKILGWSRATERRAQ